jgi:hypothetical protein
MTLFFFLFLANLIKPTWHSSEGFEDASGSEMPDEELERIAKLQAKLADVYSVFVSWQNNFCETWNDVIQKAFKADQFAGSQAEYIESLEAKNGVKLYRCKPFPEKPDPTFLLTNLPVDASIFKSTANFMLKETNRIQEITIQAMDGQPPVSGFQDFKPECQLGTDRLTCIFPLGPGGTILPVDLTPEKLIARLESLNNELSELDPLMIEIKSNIKELNTYSDKLESGTLFNNVKLPTTSLSKIQS